MHEPGKDFNPFVQIKLRLPAKTFDGPQSGLYKYQVYPQPNVNWVVECKENNFARPKKTSTNYFFCFLFLSIFE